MVSDGYLAAGYEYIIIDDCWSEKYRSDDSQLIPDSERFPSGMKALSDYVSYSRNKDLLGQQTVNFRFTVWV